MARISQDGFSSQSDSTENKTVEIEANGQNSIEVPSNDFIADASMSREGQDLVLEAPNGDTLVINNYFVIEPTPTIESPDGSVLTPNLVNSFLNSPAQFAQASTMADISPVGAVEEASGEATVIRTDGTSEPITLGTPIYQGDIIETSADGAVNVVFIDETSMAVSENARLAVDEYQFDPTTESGETNLSVLRGVFVFTSGLIGRDDPDDVMIDTPVGSIGIRGTIIAGKIQPGGESEITVVEGAIVVMNGGGEKTLSQQYETVRLGSFNDNIENVGVKNAADVGKTYGSVSDVVPKLFSSINDTAKEEAKNNAQKEKKAAEENESSEEQAIEETDEQQELDSEQNPDEMSMEESTDIFSDILAEAKHDHPGKGHGRFDNPGNRYGVHKNGHDRDEGGEIPILFNRKIDDPDAPTFSIITKQVFENSQAGDLVARVFVPTGATPPTIAGATSNYTWSMNGNFFEVRLAVSNPAEGTPFGAATITATLPDSSTIPWVINPTPGDAVINLNTPGGLHTHSKSLTSATAPIEQFDFNNDGLNDSLVGNSGANGTAGEVTINGSIINNPAPNAGDNFGHSVDGIGDFDGDGKTDFAVGSTGNDNITTDEGRVHIMLDGSTTTVSGHATGQMLGDEVSGIGDINGDGLSDILMSSGGIVSEAYVVFGGTTGNINTGALSTNGFKIDVGPNAIVAGGFVGDNNGDGFDDFAISVKMNGLDEVNTFVVYGSSGFPGTLDMNYLEDPSNALKINHNGVNSGGAANYNVFGVGDIDGDGFDDLQLGINGGQQFRVNGELERGSNTVTDNDGSGNDSDTDIGEIAASNAGDSLVGDVDFRDNFYSNLSMKGGGSNNEFEVSQQFSNIDGGNGLDTIKVITNLDFSNINFEQIDQIERLQVGQDSTTVTLTAENIFNMLKSSDNGELRIESSIFGSGTNRELNIKAGSDYSDDPTGVVNALNELGSGATHVDSNNGYEHFQIGGYDLYIDQSLDTNVVV